MMNTNTEKFKGGGDGENAPASKKAVFFDLEGSSMGARIHLWLAYRPEIASQYIETKMITAKDLQTPEYGAINPMRKAPALVRPDGSTVFEVAGEYTAFVLRVESVRTLYYVCSTVRIAKAVVGNATLAECPNETPKLL